MGSRDRKSLREAQTNVLVGVGETIAVEEVQEKLEVYKVLGCEWECIFCNMYIGEGSQQQDLLKACLEEKKHEKEALQSALHASTNRGKTVDEVRVSCGS